MQIEQIEYHPAASIFPMMTAQEFMDLKADIADNGLREPIWMYQGKIVDGRNRYRACVDLGIEPDFREWTGDGDIVKFVLSLNLHRRHLNESQRAMVAEKVANLKHGQRADYRADSSIELSVTQPQAANMLNVSLPSVKRAAHVYEYGVPDLIHAVETGRVAVSAAAIIADAPVHEQRRVVSLDNHKAILQAANAIREAKREEKRVDIMQRRHATAAQVAQIQNPHFLNGDCLQMLHLLAPKSVRLLLTDPPYGVDFQSNRREASPQAEKIQNDDNIDNALFLLDNMLLAADHAMLDDCHLLIFTGWRFEPEFRRLIESHRYTVKASIVWVKENHTSGDLYGFAPRHERIIHAVRGKAIVTPRIDDVLMIDREHSSTHPTEKPTALLRKLINSTTIERELVVDPFAGTGATLVAAEQIGRIYWGCELSTFWHAEGVVRLGCTSNLRGN